MQILLVRNGFKQAKQLKNWVSACYPNDHITVFTAAAQAMDYLEVVGEHVDLCFTDIHINGGSGMQIAAALRKHNRRSKIVFLSDTPEYAMDAWRLGINDYLLEPITLESVEHTLRSCC